MKSTQSESNKRKSLASFKANAEAVSIKESIDKITGGVLAACHPRTQQ